MSRHLSGQEWTVLADHVAPFDPETPGYVSTFNAGVREARALTARNLKTGRPTQERPTALWAGAIIYLILLEQIGKSLRPLGGRTARWHPPTGGKSRPEPALEKAIRQFAPAAATKRERQVLYALRCAFAHEFGLFNDNGTPPYRRVFCLDDAPRGRLIEWPKRSWNGRVADANRQSSTAVNLIRVGDLAEEVVRSVRRHAIQGILRSELAITELQKRYAFTIE